MREEEERAKDLLAKYVYTDKKLFVDDKPDIQSEDFSVGIEHRFITTSTAEMQARFSNEYLKSRISLSEAKEVKRKRFHDADFGFLVDNNGLVIATMGSLSSKQEGWKVNIFQEAYSDKLEKLNNGEYKLFSAYDVFFTLDKYWVFEEEICKMLERAIKINNDSKYCLKFQNIFLLTPSDFWKLDIRAKAFLKII